jgi:hypothetical protein
VTFIIIFTCFLILLNSSQGTFRTTNLVLHFNIAKELWTYEVSSETCLQSSYRYAEKKGNWPQGLGIEIIHCQISKEMSSLYFWLNVVSLFDAKVLQIRNTRLWKCTLNQILWL